MAVTFFKFFAAATGARIVASHAAHGITGGCQLLVAVVVVMMAFRAMHMFYHWGFLVIHRRLFSTMGGNLSHGGVGECGEFSIKARGCLNKRTMANAFIP